MVFGYSQQEDRRHPRSDGMVVDRDTQREAKPARSHLGQQRFTLYELKHPLELFSLHTKVPNREGSVPPQPALQVREPLSCLSVHRYPRADSNGRSSV